MASDSDSAGSVGEKVHRCTWKDHLGHHACSSSFTRASSLKRHVRSHQSPLSTTFIYQTPGSNSRSRSIHTAAGSRSPSPSFGPTMFLGLGFPDPRPTSAPSSWPAQGSGPTSAFHPPVSRDLSHFPGSTFGAGASPTQNSGSIARHTPSYNPNHSAPATPTGRVSAGYFRDESDTDSDTSAIDARPASRTISSELPVVQTVGSTDQASTSDEPRPVVPRYGIRMSKTIPSQPKALDWQTTQGKVHFIEFEDEIFARWGQLRSHWSTCLLVCEDWRHSDPLDIMALFSPENMPPVGSPRAKYSYKDHGVSLARAKVWFEKLQRTAGDLDVLLNTGPFKPMDASHVCHHEHCIKHVVYEPAHINHDRQECCNRAKFLRSEGRDVPEHCTVHGPPCMMQVRLELLLCIVQGY